MEAAAWLHNSPDTSAWWPFRMLHPLYSLAIAATGSDVAGYVTAGRGISAVASITTAVILAVWWRRHRGDVESLVVGAVLCLHPGNALYGAEIWSEPLLMPFLLVAFLAATAWWRAAESDQAQTRAAAVSGTALGIASLAKTTALLFGPGLVIAAAWPYVRSKRWRALILGAVAFCATCGAVSMLPQAASLALRGHRFEFMDYQERASKGVALAQSRPEEEDGRQRWIVEPEDGEFDTFNHVEQVGENLAALATKFVPDHLFPWFLTLPLFVIGIATLARAGPSIRGYTLLAGIAIIGEWLLLCRFHLLDRFLLPGYVWTCPMIAAGGWRLIMSARTRVQRVVIVAAVALVPLAWGISFVRLNLNNGRAWNPYREAGRALAQLEEDRPKRALCLGAEITWLGQVERRRLAAGSVDDVLAAMDDLGCDALVIGPAELGLCPDLATARSTADGTLFHGLRVIVRVRDLVVLAR